MPKTEAAPFAYEGLDRVIHEKARLGMLTSLMAHPKGFAFGDLKQLCGLTDGIQPPPAGARGSRSGRNHQEVEGKRPRTTCRS